MAALSRPSSRPRSRSRSRERDPPARLCERALPSTRGVYTCSADRRCSDLTFASVRELVAHARGHETNKPPVLRLVTDEYARPTLCAVHAPGAFVDESRDDDLETSISWRAWRDEPLRMRAPFEPLAVQREVICDWPECGFSTDSKSLLLIHLDEVHRRRDVFTCAWLDCTYSAEFRSSLRRHMWEHRAVLDSHLRFSSFFLDDLALAPARARGALSRCDYFPLPWLTDESAKCGSAVVR